MRGEVPILVYCPIDTLQWGSTHSAVADVGPKIAILEPKTAMHDKLVSVP